MRRWERLVGAAVLVAGTMIGAGVADAGEDPGIPIGQVTIDLRLIGPDSVDIEEPEWRPELFDGGSNEFFPLCGSHVDQFDDPLSAGRLYECDVFEQTTFTLGYPAVPEPYEVEWFCEDQSLQPVEAFDDPDATFTIDGQQTTNVFCRITVATGMIFIDKAFPADFEDGATLGPDPVGGAAHGDFTLEVYDVTDGGPNEGELVGTAVDDDPDQCNSPADVVAGLCTVVLVPPGEYVLGETTVPGYLPTGANCEFVGSPADGGERTEERYPVLDETILTVEASGEAWYCSLVNEYFEGSVQLTKTITNDDGGTAEMGDFTLELFRSADGTKVAEGVCAANGVCLEGEFPIDDYVVGEVGPDGYTRTVTQQINEPLAGEQLSEPDAAFTLEAFHEVIVNVASDDQPTTTTTTTTLAPTTTAAPTTAAPTTQGPTTSDAGAGAGTLPATGSSDSTGTLAAVAIALLLLGAGATSLARRRT